ncbi:hypothetical protein [Variovorax rhizosphaerae]|uniref:Uncharacterized protein n=1 Tax=Variovorax rhizosphaerae TaxID=1836200 RepID=A0ABU8X085_9BURK
MDDESAVRTMLARVLRLAQFRVAQFPSGELFMATLLRKPFLKRRIAGGNQGCDHGKRTLTRALGRKANRAARHLAD